MTKKCPFCAEEIQDDALKCKHCGEWLNKTKQKTGKQSSDRSKMEKGSADARAVTKGLKEKQLHDYQSGCGGFLLLIFSVVIGFFIHPIAGVVVFVIGMIAISNWYYKE